MSGHTPGPWGTRRDDPLCIVARHPYADLGVGSAVSFVVPPEADPHAIANARLMAAAPDLLEACKAVLPMAEDMADYPMPDDDSLTRVGAQIDSLVMILRAAIQKAEGQS